MSGKRLPACCRTSVEQAAARGECDRARRVRAPRRRRPACMSTCEWSAWPSRPRSLSRSATPVSSQEVSIPRIRMSPSVRDRLRPPGSTKTAKPLTCLRKADWAILARFAAWSTPSRSGLGSSRLVHPIHEYPIPMPTIRVKENEPFEVALRRFKRTIEKTGLLTELRAREFYEKPTAERKRKKSRPRSSATTSACAARCCRRRCTRHRPQPGLFMKRASGRALTFWSQK